MKVAIIGGGAAGFFSAIHAKMNYPDAQVILFEKTKKLLAKVKVSGGGRCNVTNGTISIPELAAAYPRGSKQLKKAFRIFNTQHTRDWFESRGVKLKTEPDNRVFPTTNDSQTIIDCLMRESRKLGVQIEMSIGIERILPKESQLELLFLRNSRPTERFDKVVVASGGSPKRSGLGWLEELHHEIKDPVPSLFTFNMPKEAITKLMGVSVPEALVSIQGTKLKSIGPLLITHWGMSGPAILKLSAFGARTLYEMGYEFKAQVNWVNIPNNEDLQKSLQEVINAHPQKLLTSLKPFGLPERLWLYLLNRVDLPTTKKWNELGKKGLNKLVNILSNDVYQVKGKTTFKEEFVTCGGVSLSNIDFKTMQSKIVPNLYFAGEVLDIDGITGGYNFQAAWTTGFIAGKLG